MLEVAEPKPELRMSKPFIYALLLSTTSSFPFHLAVSSLLFSSLLSL
jgi:hypothetical protein